LKQPKAILCDVGQNILPSRRKRQYKFSDEAYPAPELIEREPFDESVDIFAFGLIILEVIAEVEVFSGLTSNESVLNNLRTQILHIPDHVDESVKDIIRSCCQIDPTKRPTASSLIKSLTKVQLQAQFQDQSSAKLWLNHFISRNLILREISWNSFINGLMAFFCTDNQKLCIENSAGLQALVATNDTVSIEGWDSFLRWFGPLDNLDRILEDVNSILSKPYFHGHISAAASVTKLAKTKVGTFVMRFSSDPGCYAISVSTKTGVKNYRIHLSEGKFIVGNTRVDSLSSIVDIYGDALGLKYPCPGSPFESLFQNQGENAYDSEDDCGYGYA